MLYHFSLSNSNEGKFRQHESLYIYTLKENLNEARTEALSSIYTYIASNGQQRVKNARLSHEARNYNNNACAHIRPPAVPYRGIIILNAIQTEKSSGACAAMAASLTIINVMLFASCIYSAGDIYK